jgi:UDP-N-acetylmuramoyl-tripeptide--D-alanyl-D-alanine ligase
MTGSLWNANEIANSTAGIASGSWSANSVSIDSRSMSPGALFIALKGPNFDGHEYVATAIEAGAAGAMIDHRPDGLAADAPVVQVDDTMAGLAALGGASRNRTSARIVAVTGSVGKTGTKEALRAALCVQGPTAASESSFNNHWGVPLSLARMDRDAAYGVFEIGMNHPGEIAPLSRMVRPEVSIITTVAPAHIEFFDSIEQIADAKAEIFDGMTGGTAILNRDNAMFDRLSAAAQKAEVERVLSFGAAEESDARLISFAADRLGSNVEARISGKPIGYRLNLPGRHHIINSLAVFAAIDALGADLKEAARGLSELKPLAGRGKRHDIKTGNGIFAVIDESYNANPASMAASIEALGQLPANRRIAVLGEMRELGASSEQHHLNLAEILHDCGIDLVFACGPMTVALIAHLPDAMQGAHAADSGALLPAVADIVQPGDAIMVKGSLASGMRKIVDGLIALGEPVRQTVNG